MADPTEPVMLAPASFQNTLSAAGPVMLTADGVTVRLGRIRPKARPNALRLGAYLNLADVPTPPATQDWSPAAIACMKLMYKNDQLGCCVISGKGHLVGLWSGNESGTPIIATDSEIVTAYHSICGPGDQGCNISSVLDYMKSKGMTLGGAPRKIDGYVAIDWTNKLEVQVAIMIFGGITIGFDIPGAWVQTSDGDTWNITNSRIVGGHDVTICGWNANGFIVSTWGSFRTFAWDAFASKNYISEAYAILSSSLWATDGTAPSGLDTATLTDDLAKIGGGTIPDIEPQPDPGPAPPVPPPTPPTPPTPPAPVVSGLSLDQVTQAIQTGVSNGRPYGAIGVPAKVQAAAIAGVTAAWPKAGH